jgi:hypothetical protein
MQGTGHSSAKRSFRPHAVFRAIVRPHRLTRREAIGLGAAAAAALGSLRPGAALAAPIATSFELPLDLTTDGAAGAAAVGRHLTRVFTAPETFDVIGLAWPRGSHPHAEIRARKDGGRWSRWTPLHASADHGPDTGGTHGSDPVWTGAADQFQLRLSGRRSARLTARFVHAGPAARAARRRYRLTAHVSRRQTAAPPIIPRSAWGGDSVVPRADPAYGQVQLAFVHHTVNANDYGPEDSAGIVLGIARYHRDHNGWNDLGYNFLVDKYGQIFEGRAGGIDQAIVGAQAQGFNSVSTGIANIGTYSTVPLTEQALESVAKLIGWKLTVHNVPVLGEVTVTSAGGETNRYKTGTPVTFQRVSGHRDGNFTECPGDVAYGQLDDLRTRSNRYAGPLAGVTLRVAAAKIRGIDPATLSGTLRFPDGSSAAGAEVDILYATAGSAFSPISSVGAAADGTWATTLDLPQTGTIRARFPGDGARAAMESTSLRVKIVPLLDMTVSKTHLPRGRRLAISGVLWSRANEAKVDVLIERKVGGRYKRVRLRRATVTDHRYQRYLRPGTPGLYRITVSVPGARQRRYVRVT